MPENKDDEILDINLDEDSTDKSTRSDASMAENVEQNGAPEAQEATRYCPECGFALPPLAEECPRCARNRDIATSETQTQETGQSDYPTTASSGSRRPLGLIIALGVVILLIVAAPIILFNSPTFKARTTYQEALKAQLQGDLQTAQEKYSKALKHNPKMGLAAFGLGTTHLGITMGADNTGRRVTELLDDAQVGNTAALQRADRWFDRTIRLANEMPEDRKLIDKNLRTPQKLASYAHAFKSLTALIRYYASIQTGNLTVARQWRRRTSHEARAALRLDRENPYVGKIREQLNL